MAESKVRYEKSPIIESILEVFFPIREWTEDLKAKLEKLVPADFKSRKEKLQFHSFNLDLGGPGKPSSAKASEPIPRLRFWKADNSMMFQYGPDMCALNIFPAYRSLEDYIPLFESLLKGFFEEMKIAEVSNVGQRFINQVDIELDERPDSIFAVYPRLPDSVAKNHIPIAVQIETIRSEFSIVALNLQNKERTEAGQRYMLDIYLKSQNFSSAKISDIIKWNRDFHDKALETFEFALTKQGKERYGRRMF